MYHQFGWDTEPLTTATQDVLATWQRVARLQPEEVPATFGLNRRGSPNGEVGPGRGAGLSTGPLPRSRFPNRACDLAPHPALHKPRGDPPLGSGAPRPGEALLLVINRPDVGDF
jgi:hypothetical protein